jgi:hypothetical protein
VGLTAGHSRQGAGSAASGWEVETGARYWYSSGQFQKDLGTTTNPALASILNSRLTYKSEGNSGEFFGKVETPWNIFVKGNIGIGSLFKGHMNDEDWVIFTGFVPYSNTLSDPVKGSVGYETLDLVYDFFRGPGTNLAHSRATIILKTTRAHMAVSRSPTNFRTALPQFLTQLLSSQKPTNGDRYASASTARSWSLIVSSWERMLPICHTWNSTGLTIMYCEL